MTPEEVKLLNEGRYTFREAPTSTKYAGYRKNPGHVLVEEFMVPSYPLDLRTLAQRTRIPLRRLHALIRGNDRIDEFMADRFSKFFRNKPDFWLDLQEKYDRGDSL